MKTLVKQVEIERTLNTNKIEKALSQYGDPLRWAVVKSDKKKFLVEAVFLEY